MSTTHRCLDCPYEGTLEQIRQHRLALHPRPAPRRRNQLVEHADPSQLYLPSEVAKLFRVDPKTVARWAKAGKLPCIRTLGGHRRYRITEIDAILDGKGA